MFSTSHGWWMFGESVFWLLLIVGAIWLVIVLTPESSSRPSTMPSPLDILEQRFARGEISSEELRERRAELRSSRNRGSGWT